MADLNANIGIGFDTREALASLRKLQAGLSTFNQSLVVGNAAAANAQKGLNAQLIQSINATGKFTASQVAVSSSTQAFTNALEKNKFSLKEYYRYSMAAATANTKVLTKAFAQEREIINRTRKDRVKMLQSQYIQLAASQGGMVQALRVLPRHLAATNGQLNDYATRAQMAAQRQQLLNQLIKQGSTNLLNWGKNTQWAGRQLMVGLTLPLTMFAGFAAKVFKELEEEMIRFRRVYGDTFTDPGETEKALENIRRLGQEYTKYGIAVKDTVKMAADAAAAGFSGTKLTAQVETATKLAVLGNVEQQQALETTISLTNAFGLSAEELAQKINFLNAVENQTVVGIEDLTIAIPKAGPVVKQLGGSVEDLAFFLTAMKEGGINASEGANALKSGLASLINPTDKARGMLQDLGISIDAIVEKNDGNLKEIVVDFATALDQLAPLERARAIEQLFGKFQFARLSTLFQNVTKDGTQASRVLDLTGRSVEELAILSERELGAIEDATGKKFQAAIENLKQELVPLGKTFLEALTPVVKFFGNLIERFNGLGEGTKRTVAIVTGIIAGIGPVLLMTVGLVANGVANLIKFFGMLRGGIAKLNGQTNVLGGGFNYLTQEELENMAQSNALHTSHQNLVSVFNMEKTAVMQLAEAYGIAGMQARNLASQAPGLFTTNVGPAGAVKGIPVKRFSQGTARVQYYAKGTDTVPAMLTPGEAVIPAGAAQEPANKPFIEAMLAGKKVQRFQTGTNEVKTQASRKGSSGKSNFAHTQTRTRNTVDELIASGNFRGAELARLKDLQNMGFGNKELNQYAMLGFDIDDDINRRLEKTRPYIDPTTGELNDTFKKLDARKQEDIRKLLVTRDQYLSEINRKGSIYTMARALSSNELTPKDMQKLGSGNAIRIAGDYRAEMRDAITAFGTPGKSVYITDDVTDNISKKLFANPSDRFKKSLSYLIPFTKPTDFENPKMSDYRSLVDEKSRGGKQKVLSIRDGLKELGRNKVRFKKDSSLLRDIKQLKYSAGHNMQLAYDKDGRVVGFELLEKKYGKDGKFAGYRTTNIGYNNNGLLDTQRAEGGGRSGLYRKLSEKIDLGSLASGKFFTSKTGLVSFAAQSIVEEKLKGKSEKKKQKAAQTIASKSRVFKQNPKEPVVPALVAEGEELSHPRTKEKVTVTSRTGIPKTNSMERLGGAPTDNRFIFAPKGTIVSRAGGGFRRIGVPGYEVNTGQQSNLMNDPRFRGAVLLDANKAMKPLVEPLQNISQSTEGTQRATAETKELTKKEQSQLVRGQRAERVGRFSNPASMALGTAAMGAMMTGQPGAVTGGLMAASMVTSLAPMLAMMGPTGWVTTAIATLGGGLLMLNKSAESAAKAQSDLVDSTSATADKMKLVGQYTGTVGATEIMAARRSGQQFTRFSTNYERAGQQFGTNFMGSEIGKQIAEGFKTNLMQNRGNAIPAFANQLAGFISDGVMSLDQAQSVARQIAIDFNDMTLYPKITGQLNSIIAPNGQNILTNPLEVRMNITRTQRDIAGDVAKQMEKDISKYNVLSPADLLTAGISRLGQKNRTVGEIFKTTQGEKLAALAAAQGAQSLETNAAQIDALTVQYEKERSILETKKAQTTDAKEQIAIQQQIDALNARSAAGVSRLRQINAQIIQDQIKTFNIAKQRVATEDAYFDSLKQQAQKRFKGTDMEAFVEPLLEATAKLDQSVLGGKAGQELEVTINTLVAAGANPLLMTVLMETFAGKEDVLQKTLDIAIKTHGADQLLALTSNLGSIKGKKLRRELTVAITKLDEKEFTDVNSAITKLTEMEGKEFSMDVYLGKDTDAAMTKLKRLTKQLNDIEKLPDPLKKSAIADIETNVRSNDPKYANSLQGVRTYWDWFKSLPDNVEKTAVQTYVTVFDTITKKEVDAEYKKRIALAEKLGGLIGSSMLKEMGTEAEAKRKIKQELALRLTEEQYTAEDLANTVPSSNRKTKDGDKGSKATPFDNLLLRLKQVRDDTIKTAVGFEAISKRLKELFKKDGGTFSEAFTGISQQLDKLGASKGFIDAILGMSPEDWTKYKDRLFEFDDKGSIKKLTAEGERFSKSLGEITLGEFQSEQVSALRNTQAQSDAFNKLRAAGVDAATALKMVEDPIVAIEIASKAITPEEIKALAKATKEAADDAERLALQLNLVKKALDAEFYAKMPEAYAALAKMGLSADEIRMALSDPDIAKALVEDLKDGVLNSEKLLEYINNIKKAADIELQIKLSTLEGQTELFMDGFQKAMEQFAAKEQQINIRFNFSDSKEVKELDKTLFGKDAKPINLYNANKMIEGLNEQSTYYNNALDEISEKEKLVNDEYDKKVQALELVDKINNRIIQGQKQQLTLADALSQGDIAAAAKAAQDMRGQAAENALEDRRTAIDQARENALAGLTVKVKDVTYTRKQLEDNLLQIKRQQFYLENEVIVPLTKQRDTLIESITVVGKTREEWEKVKNQIDIAITTSKQYEDAMRLALSLVNQIVAGWNSIQSKQIYLDIIQRYSTQGGPTGNGEDPEVIADAQKEYAEATAAAAEAEALAKEAAAEAATAEAELAKIKTDTAISKVETDLLETAALQTEANALLSKINLLNKVAKGGSTSKTKKSVKDILFPNGVGGGGATGRFGVVVAAKGGLIPTKYLANGGSPFSIGTDTVPAMLTPGEFVVKKYAVDNFGVDKLKAINNGSYSGDSVYNYNLSVNVKSESNPDEIARTVMAQIKQVESKRLRGAKF